MPEIETQFTSEESSQDAQSQTNHQESTSHSQDIPSAPQHPDIIPLALFSWVPRSEAIHPDSRTIDSIISHKSHLIKIQNSDETRYPSIEMMENDAQEPQIIVSDFEMDVGRCYYLEVRLTIQDADYEIFGDLIEIGFLNMQRNQWDKENISDQAFGWCLFADGITAHNDQETHEYLKDSLKSGDRVGILCNLKYDSPGFLAFYVNGVSCGVAYSNVTGPVRAAVSLAQPGVRVELVRFEERK